MKFIKKTLRFLDKKLLGVEVRCLLCKSPKVTHKSPANLCDWCFKDWWKCSDCFTPGQPTCDYHSKLGSR